MIRAVEHCGFCLCIGLLASLPIAVSGCSLKEAQPDAAPTVNAAG